MNSTSYRHLLLVGIICWGLMGCSSVKFVPEGSFLLDKVNVATAGQSEHINTSMLKNYVRQKTNRRWFSTVKIPLAVYSLAGRDSTRAFNRLLKNIGEPPVLYDSILARKTCDDLRQQLVNEGYLQAKVQLFTQIKGKKLAAQYLLTPGKPYFIGKVDYDIRDSIIAQQLCMDDTLNRGIVAGMQFSVSKLNEERKRITDLLINNGYYKFHKDYITYEADTIEGSPDIALRLILHPFYNNITKTDTLHSRYHIGKVTYSSNNDGDTLIHLRKGVLDDNTFIEQGTYYSALNLQNTYNHFGRLQAVKYTNINFTEMPGNILDTHLQISTNKPSTVSFEPEGTNTAGDLGAAASLTYQNRNLFRGSENLSIQLRGAFEAISGLDGYKNNNYLEYSVETKLSFPRFILPFISRDLRRKVTASSELAFMYDLQNRPEYYRRVLSGAWRYKWNRAGHHDNYQIDLIDLNYVFMPWISDTFRRNYLENITNSNAILRYNYEDLFIMKLGFVYTYNNGDYAIKTNIESGGNLLNLASHMLGARKNSQGNYQLFRIAYAQYVKGDFDYTRNIKFDANNHLVFHIGMGIAYPYGNSVVLPFEKRYFSGGANSVRGWGVRRLGPGGYKGTNTGIDFINQTGDMRLDANIEYRSKLFWKFSGAVFVDAGNIWTLRAYKEQPNGQFRFDTFYKQIAVAYGLGLRLNFDYFILRFDMGVKAINPAYTTNSEHYALLHPDFGRDFTFHFAVGLPF